MLLPNTNDQAAAAQSRAPPARTNHSVVTWNDKLYLFGGTDGVTWFNDVWTYEPRSNAWTELDCIGYIPVAREGHAAALVNDTMYIFGGRTQEGLDLGDLAAFRISSRRWYMFQNMGHSPSARSGHSMTALGKHVVVLAGEPSSSVADRNELSLGYILDTSKIRYPPSESAPPQQTQNAPRKLSGADKTTNLAGKAAPPPTKEGVLSAPQPARAPDAAVGSRLPRAATQQPPGPPPLQQLPQQPRMNGTNPQAMANGRAKTPTKGDRAYGPPVDTGAAVAPEREPFSPTGRDGPAIDLQRKSPEAVVSQRTPKGSMDTSRSASVASRNNSQSHRQQPSQESMQLLEVQHQRGPSRDIDFPSIDSGLAALPAVSQANDDLARELAAVKSRNAWYVSELALARKAGYKPGSSSSPVFDERSAESFREEDKPLVEALLKMKAELERVQTSIATQGEDAARRIAEVERQRDAAVNEAIYAKTKLAAHGGGSGSHNGTPQPDAMRNAGTPDLERVQDMHRRLAASLAAQAETSTKLEQVTHQIEAERKAKQLAEETAEAAHRRVQELDSSRQNATAESERLRAELHEAERIAREISTSAAEAETSAKLLAIDKQELTTKLARITDESKTHTNVLQSLRDAVVASSEKSTLLEQRLEDEQAESERLRQKLAQLRAQHEAHAMELETATQRLRNAEEMAGRHAEEARHHQQAVLSGLGSIADRATDDHDTIDERVVVLQQQIETANAMARQHQTAADQASEKLRRAEERIAGLEAYQEQSSREGLTIRKQLQQSMRDMQAADAEKVDLRQQHERLRLESNAFEVQLKTLKNLLEERGVTAHDVRRSRVLDSPNSRFGTPELNRVRELEQQVDTMSKTHEELRAVFEQREHEVSKEWEEKLQALHNDHQAAVKYLRGTEKMLAKMKQELDRYKTANAKLDEELSQARQDHGAAREQTAGWEAERAALVDAQDRMKATVARLEEQLATTQTELAAAREQAETAAQDSRQAEAAASQGRMDLESLRRQYALVEERAREAESRVQMFLDQFESSVDNYRRQSQVAGGSSAHGAHGGRHTTHDSVASGESLYSSHHDDHNPSDPPHRRPSSTTTRNSMALDNLASELDALRSHWETTNKAYRLSGHFDFESSLAGDHHDGSESPTLWKGMMADLDKQQKESDQDEDRAGPEASAAGGAGLPVT